MKLKVHILLFALLGIFGTLRASEGKASLKLDRTEIKIGEQISGKLEIRFPVTENFSFVQLADTLTSRIELVEMSKIDTTYEGNNLEIKVLSANLSITSFDSGYHAIPPIYFYSENDSLGTEPSLIHVSDIEVEMPPANAGAQPGQAQPEIAIKDIKDIRHVDFSIWEWIKVNAVWIILAIVLIAGIWAFFKYIYPKLKDKKVTIIPSKKVDPPHQIALSKLDELYSQKLWQAGKIKEYHTELSEITREYIEHQFGLPALESTSGEIIDSLKKNSFGESAVNEVREMLELSDLAKFAKYQPLGDENDRSLKQARSFVLATKPMEVTEENTSAESNV